MNTNQNTPTASQVISAAITAAGRSRVVCNALGVSIQAVHAWAKRGYVPAERIKPLCEMGAYTITPDQILDAIARERPRKEADQ